MKISAPKNGKTEIVPVGLFLAFRELSAFDDARVQFPLPVRVRPDLQSHNVLGNQRMTFGAAQRDRNMDFPVLVIAKWQAQPLRQGDGFGGIAARKLDVPELPRQHAETLFIRLDIRQDCLDIAV
ncbi:hypothetical protein [Rhizobium laguerreae]|uniref:hypothetical protein n=1 Tax=Rhizobium laguerreae TaxID=1076926 RepID=UPI001FE3C0AE|nr:hypothetical protein [Rhizobium laguerreae]